MARKIKFSITSVINGYILEVEYEDGRTLTYVYNSLRELLNAIDVIVKGEYDAGNT